MRVGEQIFVRTTSVLLFALLVCVFLKTVFWKECYKATSVISSQKTWSVWSNEPAGHRHAQPPRPINRLRVREQTEGSEIVQSVSVGVCAVSVVETEVMLTYLGI